jgi:excisionase family DNA binding protein
MLADLGVQYGGRGRLLRVVEVADQLGVSNATVYDLCASGELPHVRIVDSIRVRPNDLATFVKGQLVEDPTPPAPAATLTVRTRG